MIIGLNNVVEGKETVQKAYTPLPEGKYKVSVEVIKDWVGKDFKDVDINQRDADGKIVKDDDGKNVKVKATFTAYSADITLSVTDGEFKGRKIFANVTTHPDVLFLLEGFLYAVGKSSIVLSALQKECINKNLEVEVYNRSYTKTVTDPSTGLDKDVEFTKTAVRNFFKLDNSIVDEIDGI